MENDVTTSKERFPLLSIKKPSYHQRMQTINPEETASWFSFLSFWWVNDILKLGYDRPLEKEDLYPCNSALKSKTVTAKLELNWEAEKQKNKPSFARAIVSTNKSKLAVIVVVTLFEAFFVTFPSYLVGNISSYFDEDSLVTSRWVLIYTCLLFAINTGNVMLRSMLFWSIAKLAVTIRVSTSSLIYQKACNIKLSSVGRTSVGHIINLITNDSERMSDDYIPLHNVIHTPITVIVAFVLSYFQIGLLSTLAGFLSLMCFIPLQVYMGNLIKRCRSRAAPQTDKRVKLIGEVMSSMKVIKMYNWESTFLKFIYKIRELEMRFIGICSLMVLSNNSIQTISSLLALLIMLTVKYFRDDDIKPKEVYFMMSIIESLRNGVIFGMANISKFLPQFQHSAQRMQEFLAESGDRRETPDVVDDSDEHPIKLSNVTSCWSKAHESFTLRNINVSVKPGQHIGIIGAVGAGKSSLMMTMVKEMELIEGSINVPENVAFSSQIPWIFNGTIQENILFNRPLDQERLNNVVHSCYLYPDLEVLPDGLDTLVGERGVQLSGGQRARVSLARAVYGKEDIILLDDPLSAVDTKCAHKIMNRLIKKFLSGKTVVLATHNTEVLHNLDHIIVMSHGVIVEQGTLSEIDKTRVPAVVSKKEEVADEIRRGPSFLEKVQHPEKKNTGNKGEKDRSVGELKKSLYFKFWALGLGPLALVFVFLAIALGQILKIFSDRLSLSWVREKRDKLFTYYVILAVITMGSYVLSSFFIVFVAVRASTRLHNKCLKAVLGCPMRYFDETPIGTILNRFSKDTYFADERIIISMTVFLKNFSILSASMILMTVANYYFVLIIAPILILIAFITKFYLKTSVEVRRLQAIQRSPAMSHISETLNGMCTIRSSNQLDLYQDRYYELRDNHTSANMIFLVLGRWLGQKLDFILSFLAFLATLAAVILKMYNIISPQIAGLAIVYIQNSIYMFQCFVRQGADCDNLMTSVERLFSLTKLRSEESILRSKLALKSYPVVKVNKATETSDSISGGRIEFRNVSLRYDESLPWVIHDISFDVKPGEKIGIVGPTGAGKSSILQALYQMCETKGEIRIDDVDISQLSLFQLRSSFSVIPQESLLFSGSLRQNLDPKECYSDQDLWDVLERVQLKNYISGQADGLRMEVEEMGRNLSVGQRQLVCLARALLKRCNILLIDECTANVDQDTDKMIQEMIGRSFADRTVLTIAHRLDTIIDSDRILVLDKGKIVEFDAPHVLLGNKNSMFYELYTQHNKLKATPVTP